MTRSLPRSYRLAVPAAIIALIVAALFSLNDPIAKGASGSCANSFPADGHPGPWRTTNNGGTLHGNTLRIDCPSPSTHWSVRYQIQIVNQGQSAGAVFSTTINGNGSPPDQSFSLSPYNCDTVFGYRTHADNLVTGGNANKPSGGASVHLAC